MENEVQQQQKEPRGFRNRNPLNLIISDNAWLGKVQNNTDGHFEQFTSYYYGLRAAFINARTIIKRNAPCSVQKLISIWAPAFENNVQAYVSHVCKKGTLTAQETLNFKNMNQMCRLLWAMTEVENGKTLPFHMYESAYKMC